MKTEQEITELAEKRYGTNPHSFGGQRDGFKEGFKQAQQLFLSSVMARASYNKHRGWDVFEKKVVKYAWVEEDGAVIRADGYCVGNHYAGDFLLYVP